MNKIIIKHEHYGHCGEKLYIATCVEHFEKIAPTVSVCSHISESHAIDLLGKLVYEYLSDYKFKDRCDDINKLAGVLEEVREYFREPTNASDT